MDVAGHRDGAEEGIFVHSSNTEPTCVKLCEAIRRRTGRVVISIWFRGNAGQKACFVKPAFQATQQIHADPSRGSERSGSNAKLAGVQW